MLTVDDYAQIRRAYRDGMSIRAIARVFHHSRHKVRRVLTEPEPEPYTRSRDAPAPKLGPFWTTIDRILRDDEHAPRKQRHTATRIFERLRDEHGYTGGYDQVRQQRLALRVARGLEVGLGKSPRQVPPAVEGEVHDEEGH